MAKPMTDFANAVSTWLKAQGEDRPVHIDQRRARLVVGDGKQLMHFVSTAALKAEWEANAESERELVLERRLLALRRGAPSKEAMKRRLFPRLRPRADIETLELKRYVLSRVDGRDSPELSVAQRAVGDAYAVQLVFQLSEESVDVSADRPRVWGADFDELYGAAIDNLRRLGMPVLREMRDGFWAMMGGGGHIASRLLLPELTKDLKVKGELVAMAPNLNLLLLADSADEEALLQMGRLGLTASQEPFGQWAVPMVNRDNWWHAWAPEHGHKAYRALSLAGLPGRVKQYAQAKELIDANNELDGKSDACSPLLAFQDQDGSVHTSAAWVVGSVTLLPKADRVAVVQAPLSDGETPVVLSVEWNRFSRLPGVRLDRRDGVLEYWRAMGTPDLDKLKAVGQVLEDFEV